MYWNGETQVKVFPWTTYGFAPIRTDLGGDIRLRCSLENATERESACCEGSGEGYRSAN